MFPAIPLGAGGANEIGGRFSFPGTYAVRPATLRAVYMDLASELGEQGLRWVFIVSGHGDPTHNAALDAAGSYFRDTYGGHMVHLRGLIVGTPASATILPAATKAEDGFTVHAGVEEHSFMMAVRPDLVGRRIRAAKSLTAEDFPDLLRIGRAEAWPGYFGAPRLASAAIGRQLLAAELKVRIELALKILDGMDERTMPRYTSMIAGVPGVADVIGPAAEHNAALEQREDAWLETRTPKPQPMPADRAAEND